MPRPAAEPADAAAEPAGDEVDVAGGSDVNGPADPATKPRRLSTTARGLIIGGSALAVLVVGALIAATAIVGSGADERASETGCRSEVIDSLKSPATAKLTKVETLDRVGFTRRSIAALYKLTGDDPDSADAADTMKMLDGKAQKEIDKEAKSGKRTWYVVGTVDSENGFGAMVRNTWSCETLFKGGKMTTGPDVTFDNADG